MALLATASGLAQEEILVDRIIWKGYPDGMENGHAPESFELSPDGGSFVYYQGAPLPRLMLQPVGRAGGAAQMLGPVRPHGRRTPRFSPSGGCVYFSASGGDPGTSGSTDVPARAHVVEVLLPRMELKRVFPPGAEGPGESAVFLDLHPSGRMLLIGIASGGIQDETSSRLDMAELALPATPPASLGFQISGLARVRYSGDGGFIAYTVLSPATDAGQSELHYLFDRERRTHRRVPPAEFAAAGNFQLKSFIVPHLGSFGWDGFVSYAILPPATFDGLPVPIRFSQELLAVSKIPPQPLCFRKERVLLSGGRRDQPLPIVATFERRKGPAALPGPAVGFLRESGGSRVLWSDPSFFRGAILARRSLELEPLILRLARSLRPGGSRSGAEGAKDSFPEVPCALEARLLKRGLGAAAGSGERVEILETSAGRLRVERFREVPADAGPDADEEPAGPVSEMAIFDGETCSIKTVQDSYVEVPPELFCREVNSYSLFRLFLDPVRLGDPRLRFTAASRVPAGQSGGKERWNIAFSYEDGYSGDLVVEVTKDGVLPVLVSTPFLFESERLGRAIGQVPERKTVTFGGWRPWMGRLVPHELEFDDGIGSWALELLEMSPKNDAGAELFQTPGRGK